MNLLQLLFVDSLRFVGAIRLLSAPDTRSDKVYRRAQINAWCWRAVAATGVALIAVHMFLVAAQPNATDAAMREWAGLFGSSEKAGSDDG